MEKLVYAALGLVAGLVIGAVVTWQYLEDDFNDQRRVLLMINGNDRASACQMPEDQRPKNLDCRGLVP